MTWLFICGKQCARLRSSVDVVSYAPCHGSILPDIEHDFLDFCDYMSISSSLVSGDFFSSLLFEFVGICLSASHTVRTAWVSSDFLFLLATAVYLQLKSHGFRGASRTRT